MELKLQLSLFMLFIEASLAVWQHVTVLEGATLTLTCPITNAHRSHVEWKDPKGYVMFFNHNKALKDRRYSIDKLSKAEFTISVSEVTFKDGGNYTCRQYNHGVTEKTVEVTVLGHPKMEVVRHGGKVVIKCTAVGNHYPPKIYWRLGHGIEIAAQPHYLLEEGISTYVSVDKLHVQSVGKKVKVKCLVRHPALHTEPLMDFIEIGRTSTKFPRTTLTSSPTTQPQRSTEMPRTTRERTTNTTTTDLYGPSSERSVTSSEPETVTSSTGSHLSSTTNASESSVLPGSTGTKNDTISNVTSTTGGTPVSEATEENTSYNGTEGNSTRGGFDEKDKQTGNEGSSSLLVFLVTCLIFALLVVVIFFAVKLRRAHILWKRVFIVTENEESEQSEESSKSKSSNEERHNQGQRRRGLFNMGFTKYVIEEPTEITTATNTTVVTAAESLNKEQTSEPHISPQTAASASNHIKETEL
uniref:uncharacterized protein isoform X2 n=1 Tax=Centroberyx gerrardi TaxID=166262 RepID=UPI003AB0A32E